MVKTSTKDSKTFSLLFICDPYSLGGFCGSNHHNGTSVNGTLQFVHVYYVIVYNSIVSAAIITFLAIFTYLMHNAKKSNKKIGSKLFISRKVIGKTVGYGFILAIANMLVLMILFRYFSFENMVTGIIRDTIFAVICWFLIVGFNRKFERKLSLPALILTSFFSVIIIMQFIFVLVNFFDIVLF